MATITGAHSTYDEPVATGGNREDLSDMLYDVTPADTPFLSAIKKTKATGTSHDWLTDVLSTGNANAQIEGEDATGSNPADRIRLSNYTQILKKEPVVTGTQEVVLKGGSIKSELAYQVARRLREIKTDWEYAAIGVDNAKAAGSTSAAREMASLSTYITSGTAGTEFAAATSAAPTGNGVDTPTRTGTNFELTESRFASCLANLYTNSGGNSNVLAFVPATYKQKISTYTASSTRYVTTDDKKLVASIDVYDGDFHTVKIVPNRFINADSIFIVDAEYMACADLRPVTSYDLAKTGDSYRKEIVWETTLEVCNPDAHVHIWDLATS